MVLFHGSIHPIVYPFRNHLLNHPKASSFTTTTRSKDPIFFPIPKQPYTYRYRYICRYSKPNCPIHPPPPSSVQFSSVQFGSTHTPPKPSLPFLASLQFNPIQSTTTTTTTFPNPPYLPTSLPAHPSPPIPFLSAPAQRTDPHHAYAYPNAAYRLLSSLHH